MLGVAHAGRPSLEAKLARELIRRDGGRDGHCNGLAQLDRPCDRALDTQPVGERSVLATIGTRQASDQAAWLNRSAAIEKRAAAARNRGVGDRPAAIPALEIFDLQHALSAPPRRPAAARAQSPLTSRPIA